MQKGKLRYCGKAKSLFETDQKDCLIMEFRDDTSAFDGERLEQLAHKGAVNNAFNAFIMLELQKTGIPVHFIKQLDAQCALVKALKMLPIECVVRNLAAGGIVKRLGLIEGQRLMPPTFELFLKNDALHDPMINTSIALSLGLASAEQLAKARDYTFQINRILQNLFQEAGIVLVDFKLEFGLFEDEVILGDEFTPDNCRLWDSVDQTKLDKDRFRQGLGEVVESYQQVANRLGIVV